MIPQRQRITWTLGGEAMAPVRAHASTTDAELRRILGSLGGADDVVIVGREDIPEGWA